MTGAPATTVGGRLVLDDRVASGRLTIEDGRIAAIALDDEPAADGPYVAPGFVDVHVHGWGGHDAMGDRAALDGMARRLLRRGVTSFLPTAVTAPLGSWSPSPNASGPGGRTPRPTAPSRSGSTWRDRSSPPPGAGRTTRPTSRSRVTCRVRRSNRSSTGFGC